MFDYVVGVELQCDKGHPLDGFQTKDFDCILGSIVFEEGRLVSCPGRTMHCSCGLGVDIPHLVNMYTNCRHQDCQVPNGSFTMGTWQEFNLHLSQDGTILEVERVPDLTLTRP